MRFKSIKPMLTLKSGLKAGIDPRGYCLQGCVTQSNQCAIEGGENCDSFFANCLNRCTHANQPNPLL